MTRMKSVPKFVDSAKPNVGSYEPSPQVDMVNSPPHYNQGSIECIEAIKAQLGIEGFVAYLRGTIAKYNWRLLHKFDPVEDASKMRWYQDRLIIELITMKGMKEAGTL